MSRTARLAFAAGFFFTLTAALTAQSLILECVTAKRQEQRAYPHGLPGTMTNVRAKRLARIAVDLNIRNFGNDPTDVTLAIVFFGRRAVTSERVVVGQQVLPLKFQKGQIYRGQAESPQIEATELYEYGGSNSRVIEGYTTDGWLVQLKSGERTLKQVASQSALEEIGRDERKLKSMRADAVVSKGGGTLIRGEMLGTAAPAANSSPTAAVTPPSAAEAPTPQTDLTSAAPTPKAVLSAAEFEQRVAASQRRAVAKYPALGTAGSPLNRQFVAEIARIRAGRDIILQDPTWPELVADRLAKDVAP